MLGELQAHSSEVSRAKEALQKELQMLVSTRWESTSQHVWLSELFFLKTKLSIKKKHCTHFFLLSKY